MPWPGGIVAGSPSDKLPKRFRCLDSGRWHRLSIRVLGPLEIMRGPERLALGPHDSVRSSPCSCFVTEKWFPAISSSRGSGVRTHPHRLGQWSRCTCRTCARCWRNAAGRMAVTRAPGYVLDLRADTLDLDRFRRLASDARSAAAGSDAAKASELFRAALGLLARRAPGGPRRTVCRGGARRGARGAAPHYPGGAHRGGPDAR